jgi:hypothetical protein
MNQRARAPRRPRPKAALPPTRPAAGRPAPHCGEAAAEQAIAKGAWALAEGWLSKKTPKVCAYAWITEETNDSKGHPQKP